MGTELGAATLAVRLERVGPEVKVRQLDTVDLELEVRNRGQKSPGGWVMGTGSKAHLTERCRCLLTGAAFGHAGVLVATVVRPATQGSVVVVVVDDGSVDGVGLGRNVGGRDARLDG
jgi:hypothetical protein